MSKINEEPADRPWMAFKKQPLATSVFDDYDVNSPGYKFEAVIEPVLVMVTEAEEDVFAEFLIGLGWTPPEGSRWSK